MSYYFDRYDRSNLLKIMIITAQFKKRNIIVGQIFINALLLLFSHSI